MPRAGGDSRGSSRDRRSRKLWMLRQFGNGHVCPCAHCSKTLTFETLEADRIKPGGAYSRDNIQPSCRHCNASRSDNISWQPPSPATFRAVALAA